MSDEHMAGRHEMALLAIRIVNKSHAPEYLRVEMINNIVDEAVGAGDVESAIPDAPRPRAPYAKSSTTSSEDVPL